MDRRLSPETLIEYHFGTLEGPARTAVEEALLESEESLRAYLRLKRELDGAYSSEDVPSPAAKARLRAAVQQEVGARQRGAAPVAHAVAPVGPTRPAGWAGRLGQTALGVFWRPIPLYQTLAVAAAAAVLVGFLGLRTPRGGEAPAALPTSVPAPTVDFTGTRPVGLDVL